MLASIRRFAVVLCLMTPNWAEADTILSSQNGCALCTQEISHWIDFCNGLIRGYADHLGLAGEACIPNGTSRTTMITLFTDRLPSTSAYSSDKPAFVAAIKDFFRGYIPASNFVSCPSELTSNTPPVNRVNLVNSSLRMLFLSKAKLSHALPMNMMRHKSVVRL